MAGIGGPTPPQDGFFDGEFYEENSFLVLAKGDELSAHSSPNTSPTNRSVDSQKSQYGDANETLIDSQTSVPKPLPRSNTGQTSADLNHNGSLPMDDPVSSHFGSVHAGSSQGKFAANVGGQMKKSTIDQPEVSLASVISSNSSITPSEADSLDESMKLIHILKTENEGLKGILAQRNETLREEIKSIHSTSAMYESKHADQLQKYEECVKAIAELRAENTKLKEQLALAEKSVPGKDEIAKVEALEQKLNDKESLLQALEDEIQVYGDVAKRFERENAALKEQRDAQKLESDSILEQRDAIQFELTDARITIANFSDELRKLKAGGIHVGSPAQNDHLESALRTARLHLTNMRDDNERKNALIATLTEQKQFCEAQMKEFETNFKDERDEKVKLAETLSVLQIELEKTKSDLVKKSEELEKLHQTHLILANEHLNRNRENSVATPPGPDEFVFINRARQSTPPNVRDEQVQTTPPAAVPPASAVPIPPPRNSGADAPLPSARQQERELPTGSCPLCYKIFSTPDALMRHASNCGMSLVPGQNPFIHPFP